MYLLEIVDPVTGEVVERSYKRFVVRAEHAIADKCAHGLTYRLTLDGQPVEGAEYAYRLSRGL